MSGTEPVTHDTAPRVPPEPLTTHEPPPPGIVPDPAREALSEVQRQKTRLDAHAARLLTLAAILTTLSTTTLALTRHAPWSWALAPLAASAALWAGTTTVLLLGVIRPSTRPQHHRDASLGPNLGEQAGPTKPDNDIRAMTPTDYRPHHAGELQATVTARYHALRLATDLLLAGFAPLTVTALALLTRILLP